MAIEMIMPQAKGSPGRARRRLSEAVRGAVAEGVPARGRPVEAQSLGRAPLVSAFMDDAGVLAVARVAETFGMSKGQLAETVGLRPTALYRTRRVRAAKTQARVRDMLEIVSRIADWAGGKERAMAWYRAQPIAAFGGRTAESLVKSGQASAVRDYLDSIALGGYA